MGPRAGLDGCGKYHPHRDFFFVLSSTLYFIRTCVFVLIVINFSFCLYLRLTTQTSELPTG